MTLQKKYIPQTWDEIVGQEEIVSDLSSYKTIEELPNLMFTGQSGIGKTASAYVLAKSLGVPIIEKNASDERGIDTIRNEIKTLLFTTGKRIIFLDEAGNLCLHPDTKIIVNGLEQKIKEVVDKSFTTLSYNFLKREKTLSSAKCIDSGKNFLYRVVLDNGKEIICSENQPFFTKNGEVKKLKELKPNDEIITFE